MPFYNSFAGFLYRQFFLYPSVPSTLSLSGQAGLVTGSNTGLGYHASLQLLEAGLSHLILAVRNKSKGEEARESLFASLSPSESSPRPTIEVWELDLASYESIIAFIERLKESSIKLDFAILNAGVINMKHELNPSTGHEVDIQINWLSTALLTLLLLPILEQQSHPQPQNNADTDSEKRQPVLTIIGSETAAWAKFAEAKLSQQENKSLIETLDSEKHFVHFERYWTSKLLQQIFFIELVRRRPASASTTTSAETETETEAGTTKETETGTRTVLNIVNPGLCTTDLNRQVDMSGLVGAVSTLMLKVLSRTSSVGARTLVHAAVVAGPESHGKYLSDCRVAPFADLVARDGIWEREVRGVVWDEMVREFRGLGVDVEGISGVAK